MNIIAIIIARGGSRRVPRKNVADFCGRPLVEWSIIHARASRCLTDADIYLSTDDDEIAEIGYRNKINIIRRPDWPNPDAMSAVPVYEHAIETVAAIRPVTHIVSLLPTSPCRLPDDIDQVLATYLRLKPDHPDCREVVTVCSDPENVFLHKDGPRAQIAIWDKRGEYLAHGPTTEIKDLSWWREEAYGAHQNDGDEFIFERADKFLHRKLYYRIGRWFQRWDVDDQETFELNEFLFERYILKGRGDSVYWDYKHGGSNE